MLPSKKIEDFASGCLDALLAKYDESSKAKMHQGPLMPSLPSMNLPNSYFGKLRISPIQETDRQDAERMPVRFAAQEKYAACQSTN